MRIPKHLGVIPDGNRRWAESNGLSKERGYANGLDPGLGKCRSISHRKYRFSHVS